MKLIADSGSTKTSWVLTKKSNIIQQITTDGINPYYQDENKICETIKEQLFTKIESINIDEIYFYGAGCASPEKNKMIADALGQFFPTSIIAVNSDLLGAARSLCGSNAGIAAILGTGSNSCFFSQDEIVKNVSPLGFILGDEGSGAVLGKKLIGDFLKNQMPKDLSDLFASTYNINAITTLDRVYKKPFPNRYLASFVPFMSENKSNKYVYNLIYDSFTEFIVRNIKQYDYQKYPIHFTGSIAYNFKEILSEVVSKQNMKLGNITQNPIEGLVRFHK
ncbi:MAG: ATPase [Paludibacteraceae bacterium]|jgi:N-acetylglucosamine kinase-like BadF-type ATPase|nr:ATPase [Paludibacteraceae bacterium]OQA48670.1 MAG: BadF/BadG/BcrA/BcrD ATPase family protein [Bacteroidetes bacterium ADurb.Bin302]HOH95967.1 ATPase [Candidatus Enterocola sp.]HPG54983.1 ATPase [Candidatus Enterocola sp.]